MTWSKLIPRIVFAVLLVAAGSAAQAASLVVEGTPVTGFNRLFGQPVWDFGPLGTPGFTTAGAHNPGGSMPMALTPASPSDTLLATIIDPFWFLVTGIPPAEVADQDNVPLRDSLVAVDAFGGTEALPDLFEGTQLEFTRALSNGPITLGNWLAARGQMQIHCNPNGSSVRINFHDLIPNGLYSVWAGFETRFGGNPFLGIGPLGGVPNAFVADSKGKARFERVLNFCPIDLAPGEVPLVVVDVVFHANQSLYGARPSLPRVKLFSGVVSQSQLNFLVSGTPVQ